MNLQQQFAAEVAAFIKAKNLTPTWFGKQAAGDPSFVFELEKGRAPNLRTIERVRGWMASHTVATQ